MLHALHHVMLDLACCLHALQWHVLEEERTDNVFCPSAAAIRPSGAKETEDEEDEEGEEQEE